MSMFPLAITCLITSSLPWFVDLTFQVPMQYCSSQHQTLLPSLNKSCPQEGLFYQRSNLLGFVGFWDWLTWRKGNTLPYPLKVRENVEWHFPNSVPLYYLLLWLHHFPFPSLVRWSSTFCVTPPPLVVFSILYNRNILTGVKWNLIPILTNFSND